MWGYNQNGCGFELSEIVTKDDGLDICFSHVVVLIDVRLTFGNVAGRVGS